MTKKIGPKIDRGEVLGDRQVLNRINRLKSTHLKQHLSSPLTNGLMSGKSEGSLHSEMKSVRQHSPLMEEEDKENLFEQESVE